jgi:hypothetical protein
MRAPLPSTRVVTHLLPFFSMPPDTCCSRGVVGWCGADTPRCCGEHQVLQITHTV